MPPQAKGYMYTPVIQWIKKKLKICTTTYIVSSPNYIQSFMKFSALVSKMSLHKCDGQPDRRTESIAYENWSEILKGTEVTCIKSSSIYTWQIK